MRHFLALFFLLSGYGLSQAQCVGIDFTASSTHVCAPGVVVFRATGYMAGSTFVWKVGAVQFTGADSAVQVFSQKGQVSVTLEITDAANRQCVVTKNNYITVSEPEEPTLAVSSKLVCSVPASIQLKNTTTGFSRIDWFIEGEKLLNKSDTLTYQFTNPGSKRIGLRVFDQYGCGRLRFFDSAISVNQAPQNVAVSLNDQWGCNTVKINYGVATDPVNFQVQSYEWVFQGSSTGNIGTGTPAAQATYQQSGNYPVQLTLRTQTGCAYKHSQSFQIEKPDSLLPSFTASNTLLCEGNDVDFKITSQATQFPGVFTWAFQGGSLQSDTALNTKTAKVFYDAVGEFTVRLQHSYKNCVTTKTNLVRVYPGKNDFVSADNIECSAPHTVHFKNAAPDSTGKTILWRFYDGKGKQVDSSRFFSPAFTYTKPGSYKVEMLVSRPGCTQLISKKDFVQIAKPKASFEGMQQTCMGDSTYLFSTTQTFTSDTVKYKWYLWNKKHTALLSTTNMPFVRFVYPDTGYYDVSFVVKSSKCSDTVTQKKYVRVYQMDASLNKFTTPVCQDEPVNIEGLVSHKPADVEVGTSYYFWRTQDSAATNFTTNSNINTISIPGIYHMQAIKQASATCADTLQAHSVIKVSGINALLEVEKITGCQPYHARVKVRTLYNIHFGKPNDHRLTYQWQLIINGVQHPLTGNGYATCTIVNDSVCELHITKRAAFGFSVLLKNSDNCQFKVANEKLLDLDIKPAFELPEKACKGSYRHAVNNSHSSYQRFRWVAGSSKVSFLPSDTAANPQLLLNDTGNIAITLEAYTASGCVDTSMAYIHVADLDINFFTNDTIKKCAPALVHFEVKPQPATTFHWDMGDGNHIQSTTGDVFYMYGVNTGNISDRGFNVTLHATNAHGCSHTLTKQGYVKIIGPAPYFTTQQTSGCEPFEVHFTNKSRNMSEHYFDFGDGSQPDSNNLNWVHTYVVRQAAGQTETYQPRLIAYDKEYCFSIYQMNTPVEVYVKPVAAFVADTQVACTGKYITLHDSTPLATNWQWSVGNISVPGVQHPSLDLAAGHYDVQLLVSNKFGCSDTLLKPQYLQVFASPTAAFKMPPSEVCPGSDIRFISTSGSVQPITGYSWNFGEPQNGGQSVEQNPVVAFTSPGYKTISLRVTDSVGCSDVKTRDSILFVIDSVIAGQPVLSAVSFNKANAVEITWHRENIRGFKEYQVYQSDINTGNWQLTGTRPVAADTMLVDYSQRALAVAQAYRVVLHNVCNNYSQPSEVHHSMHAAVDTSAHASNKINWNAYTGWPVASYRIWGSDDPAHKPFKLLCEQTDTHFTHGYICPGTKYYYIEAIAAAGAQLVSRSQMATGSPNYEAPAFVTPVALATVVNDQAIHLTWKQESNKWRGIYEIDRHEENRGWQQGYASSNTEQFLDENVHVNNTRYIYRIRFADTCSLQTPAGLSGTNILLQGNVENDRPVLRWTAYEKWEQGVNHYLVQQFRNNRFVTLARVSPDSTQYTDEVLHTQLDSAYVYCVLAVSNNFSDTSISNRAAATPASRLWIPNAFTPNNDGLNDVFLPVALGVYNEAGYETMRYELRIYNRWGALIFQTNSLQQGWDGTFQNSPCPEDVYSYEVYAAGVDYKKYSRAGTLHLMR